MTLQPAGKRVLLTLIHRTPARSRHHAEGQRRLAHAPRHSGRARIGEEPAPFWDGWAPPQGRVRQPPPAPDPRLVPRPPDRTTPAALRKQAAGDLRHALEKQMVNSHYRWVIVAAGGLLGCVAIGAMFSLPVFLGIDRARHRLVGDRRVERDDDRLSGDGLHQHGLGQPVRPLRPARGRPDRLDHPGGRRGAGEPDDFAARVPAHLRAARRRQHRGDLRADDGLRDRLVRHASQPRGVARIRRHGRRADDHVAVGGLARLELRLANIDAHHRRHRGGRDDPGRAAGAPSARSRWRGRRDRCAAGRGRNPACRSGRRCGRRSSSSCC